MSLSHNTGENQRTVLAVMDKDIESADEGQRNRDRWSKKHYYQLAMDLASLPEVKLPGTWIEMGGNESETRQSVRKEKQRVNERRVTHYCQIAPDVDQFMAELQISSAKQEIPANGKQKPKNHDLRLSEALAELPIPCTSDYRASQQDTGLQSQFQTTESVDCEVSLSEYDPDVPCGSGFFPYRSNEGEEWSISRQREATESSTFPRQESLSEYNPDATCESTCRPLNYWSYEVMQSEWESNSCDQREATESVSYQELLSEYNPNATCGTGYWQQAVESYVMASFTAYLELPCLIRRDEEELGGGHVLHDVHFQPPIPPREKAGTYEQDNSQEASVQEASQKSGGKNSNNGKKIKGHYVELAAGLITPELAKLNGVMNGHSEEHETTATNGAAGIVESEGVAVLQHMHATSQNTLVTSQQTHTSSWRSRNSPEERAAAEYCRQQVQEQQKLIDNMAPELQALVIEMIRRDEEELGGGHVLRDVYFQPPIPPREKAGTYEQNNSQEASVHGASQKSGGKNSNNGKKKKGHYVELAAGLITPELAKLNGVMNGHSEEHETTATNGAAGIVESEGVAVLQHMHATSQNTLVTSQQTHTSSWRSRNSPEERAAAEYCRQQVQEQQKLIDNMAPELQALVIEMIRRDEEELGGGHVLRDVYFQPPIPPREKAGTYEQNNSQEASVHGASQKSGGKNSNIRKKKKGHYVELAGLISPELAKLNGVMNGHSEEYETTATNGAAGTVESDGVSQGVVGYSPQGENSAQHGARHNGAYSRFPRSSHQCLWGSTSRDQSHTQTSQPNRQRRGNGNHSMGKRPR